VTKRRLPAKGIVQDRAAVHAALTQPWSNGQTEGQMSLRQDRFGVSSTWTNVRTTPMPYRLLNLAEIYA
jgi:hypothetical protein